MLAKHWNRAFLHTKVLASNVRVIPVSTVLLYLRTTEISRLFDENIYVDLADLELVDKG